MELFACKEALNRDPDPHGDVLFHRSDAAVLIDVDDNFDRRIIQREELDVLGPNIGHRERQGEVVERVKRDADLVTDGAHQSRLVHAGEEVGDDRVVPLLGDIPDLGSHFPDCRRVVDHLVGRVGLLNVGFLLDAVQVLLETVQQEAQKFLRVLLAVPRERRGIPADGALEIPRRDGARGGIPVKLFQQAAISGGDLAIVGQRVVRVDLFVRFVRQEVLGELLDASDALERRVHVARVAQVL